MRKIALTIISLILVSAVSMGQSKKNDELFFESTLHDYGSMSYGADGTYDFVFKNQSKKPVVLTDVKSSCGCTVATWPKEPIQPGQSSSIRVVYNTRLSGPFNKTITVYSTAKNSPVRLSVMGKVARQTNEMKTKAKRPKSAQNVSGSVAAGEEVKNESLLEKKKAAAKKRTTTKREVVDPQTHLKNLRGTKTETIKKKK